MIRHARVSESLRFFKDRFFRRWGFSEARDDMPVVMFGMYKKRDATFFNNHKAHVTLVWGGTDASKNHVLKREAKHIALSSCIQRRLRERGIESEVVPISVSEPHMNIQPMGDKIYHYGKGEKYGEQYVDEIEKNTGIEVIRAHQKLYKPSEMPSVYRKCFIGLRLTPRDGLPNTVVELGLMGRRCVFNGDLPGSIPWKGVDDICKNVLQQYDNRWKGYAHIAQQMYDHINISDQWLKI